MSDVNSARRWNPDTNEWEVVKEGEGDIVGTGVNYAGVTVPALDSVDIAPTTKLMRDSGEFQDLDVAGTTVLHGKLKVQGALSTKWFDASPTAGATVCYLDFENGPQQYLYLTADTTVWLPTTNQSEGFFSLCVEQDAVGGWDITWKINVVADGSAACPWPDGIDPVMDPDPSAVEVYQFTWCQNLNSGNGAYVGMPVQALTIPPAVGADARKAPVLSAITSELFRPNIIRIAWSYTPGLDYIENAIEFELQRKEAQYLDGNGDVITPLVWGDYAEIYAGTDYTYTDVGLDRTHKYLYRVRASSRFTEAGYSAWLELAAAVQPSGVLAMDVQANELYNRLTTGGVLSSHIGVAAVTADKIFAGALLAYGVNVVNRFRGCTVKFSHLSDYNVVWNSGHLLLAKATYTADPGQSASLTDVSWGTIELDITGSYKTLEHGTDYYAYVTWVEDTYGEPASIGALLWSNTYPLGKNDIVLALVNINADGKVAVETYGATGTVINGDHITTGSIDAVAIKANTITTSQLNFTPVTGSAGALSTQVVGAINASSEGIKIYASKINISGDCTFSAGYDPTGKIASGGAAADVNANVTTISGGKITTNTITADRMDVSSLSAISADIGTITSGTINGVTINGATLQTHDHGQRITIDMTGQGTIYWYDSGGGSIGELYMDANNLHIRAPGTDGKVCVDHTLYLATGKGMSFDGHALYMSGHNLMLGATVVATWA